LRNVDESELSDIGNGSTADRSATAHDWYA
jgi:hypothetical protein